LIHVLLQAIESLGSDFVVIGGKAVHLLQNAEAHLEDEILNRTKIHQLCQRKEAKPENV